jgi:ammonia channel protein AmtB
MNWEDRLLMKISKMTVIGLLICLISLYLMSDVWVKDEVLRALPVSGAYGFPIGVIVIGLFKK